MTPQDILNAQYTAPDMPDVSQVAEAMRTVREHVARNKGPYAAYALLAASLPVIGYGAHRAMKKTPEAEPEPSVHTAPATTQPAEIQQGGDKIAEAVLARFGLKVASPSHMAYGPNVLGSAIRGGVIGGLGTAAVSAYRQRDEPNLDWDRIRKSSLQGAGVGAVVNGGLGALGVYAHNSARDVLHGLTEQFQQAHPVSSPISSMYEDMARAHVRDIQANLRNTPRGGSSIPHIGGPATTQPAEIQQGGDKIAEEVLARFGLRKEAFRAQAVGGALGALGGAYAGWQGGKDQNTFDRVLGAGAGAVGGGALGMAAGHGASKLYGRLTTPASVPGAQAMFSAMHGGGGGVHAPPPAAAPRPGVQPPGVRAAPPAGPPRAAPPPHASPDPSPLRASVPAEHQEKFDKIPAHLQQGVADHMGWGTPGTPTGGPIPEVSGQVLSKEQARAAVLGIPPTPPGVQSPGARPKPPVGPPRAVPPPGPQAAQPTISAAPQAQAQAPAPKGPYYADVEAMLNDGLMPSFHGRARQAWDSGLVPNTSHDWIMAHNLHSLNPEEHASALAEFAPQDWEHKLLTAMGPRQPKVSPAPTA